MTVKAKLRPLAVVLGAISLTAAPALADMHMQGEESTMRESQVEIDIVDTAVASPDFNTLVAAVQHAELVETLKAEGPYTVFAPTDAAFAAIPEETMTVLLSDDGKAQLTEILTCHVVAAEVMASSLTQLIANGGGSYQIETVGECTLTATLEEGNVRIADAVGHVATVTIADVDASNGVIHAIDTVLMPAP